MADWCSSKKTDDVLVALSDLKIPGAPVLSPQQAIDHPHVKALGFLENISYPTALKDIPISNFPISMTASPGVISHRAPELGEHTDEILLELGYSESEITQLHASRVV
jgi:crotonobetainyl-CoA:carnitine CoA-transferase CaiB-like acyl-CoA transferase